VPSKSGRTRRLPKEAREALEAERRAARWHKRDDAARALCSQRIRRDVARGQAPALSGEMALCEGIEALAYTRQWHAVNDWAEEVAGDVAVDGEWSHWPTEHDRLTRVRAHIVADIDNEEEAFESAIPIFALHDWLARIAPTRAEGGQRRVVIRVFAWVMDRDNDVAYDPEWLKVGDDMSCQAAEARALRWARSYDQVLAKGQESREIRMTALEIGWWTRSQEARLV